LYNGMNETVGALIVAPIVQTEVPIKQWLACCSRVPENKSEIGKGIRILL
jgi:hypothetical protein